MSPQESPLKKQLEMARFERAIEVSESLAQHRALLTTMELERLNHILTGKSDDPWRSEPVTLTFPSGKTETMQVIGDPKVSVRDKLHIATEMAEAGNVIDATVTIYSGIVMIHPFQDANRRTAVIAAHYFLHRYGVPISGTALHELGLGNLREEGQIDLLRDTIAQMARFTAQHKPAPKN